MWIQIKRASKFSIQRRQASVGIGSSMCFKNIQQESWNPDSWKSRSGSSNYGDSRVVDPTSSNFRASRIESSRFSLLRWIHSLKYRDLKSWWFQYDPFKLRDAWHWINRIVISWIGFQKWNMVRDPQNVKSWKVREMGPWSQHVITWEAGPGRGAKSHC